MSSHSRKYRKDTSASLSFSQLTLQGCLVLGEWIQWATWVVFLQGFHSHLAQASTWHLIFFLGESEMFFLYFRLQLPSAHLVFTREKRNTITFLRFELGNNYRHDWIYIQSYSEYELCFPPISLFPSSWNAHLTPLLPPFQSLSHNLGLWLSKSKVILCVFDLSVILNTLGYALPLESLLHWLLWLYSLGLGMLFNFCEP